MSGTLVPPTLDVDNEVPHVEVPVATPQDEVRASFSAVETLLDAGVPRREILVVASSLREYEPPLSRAAIRLGLTPTFWTQLDLTNTQLYQLLYTTCELLDGGENLTAENLQTALTMGWIPPDPDVDTWPLPQRAAGFAFEGIEPDAQFSLSAWHDELAGTEKGGHVHTLLDWLDQDRSPAPETVEGVLHGLVEQYREHVLPVVKDDDVPALLDTETAARATVRMETLAEQVAAKYRSRRTDSRMAASWANVASLIEAVASQAPGRREHANARAIDVMEPNDVWPKTARYVIILGLVEGEWPSPTESLVPAELRHAINADQELTETLLPRASWTGGRAVDQFAEVLDAATEGVLLVRHTQTIAGEAKPPSSLLEMVPTSTADAQIQETLLRDTTADPDPLLDALGLSDPENGDRE